MAKDLLKEFVELCVDIGSLPDYVQGGGGNTSVKLDDTRMAVKASGYQIKQITESDGYVIVDYKAIADYHKTVDTSRDVDLEKEASAFVKAHVLETEGLKPLRPSVEAGFHSILKTFVTHTHPVYANILTCCTEGPALAEKILKDKPYAFIWLPYINPGFELTLAMHREIEKCISEKGKFPQVIFMQNHGLVTTSDCPKECNEIHKDVNNTIRNYFGITEPYPELKLEKQGENMYFSASPFLLDFFGNHTAEVFDELTLYPDQLVYLNSSNKEDKIALEPGRIVFKTTESEAFTILETMMGYVYVVKNILAAGKQVQTMGQAGIDFINNWESEKYRKSLAK